MAAGEFTQVTGLDTTFIDSREQQSRIQERIHALWEDPTEFPDSELGRSITARFEEMAQAMPDHILLISAEDTATYSEVNDGANRIARALVSRAGTASGPVGLMFD